jgi:uncharacterized protein (TIGR02118 family)
MKVLLTVGSSCERDVLERTLNDEAVEFVKSGKATRAAVDVRAGGIEGAETEAKSSERAARAMVSLWGVESADAALKYALPDTISLVGAFEVEEVVQKDWQRTWPSGETSPGVKLICFVRRKADITHEYYLQHWRYNHGPLAVARQPGFWHYVQNHIVDWLTEGTPNFDGIGELHFKSPGEVKTGMFDSAEGERLIVEDTLRFIDRSNSTVLVSKETLFDF